MPQLSRFYREETLGCAFLCFVCHWVNEQVATFLGGSYARGSADAHSDLDLCVITTDGALEEFLAARAAFIRQLGEPVFLESFDQPNIAFFILASGAEGELYFGSEGHWDRIHS